MTDQTIIKVLQAPMGIREEPKSRDHSEGRFMISQKGLLDPEIYSKARKVTVAGIVVGTVVEKINDFPQPHISRSKAVKYTSDRKINSITPPRTMNPGFIRILTIDIGIAMPPITGRRKTCPSNEPDILSLFFSLCF